LFDPILNLSNREILALILHDVGALVNSSSAIDIARAEIDVYLDKTNNPKGEITALPAYRMVEFSSKNCKTFLESNKLLIYSAIAKNNLVKNARKSIDVTDYLINLLVQLYGYGERNRVVDIISEIFSNQPKIKEKLHDEF